nr:RNA 2',3'-cyclic phosphodiesterase [Streptomyces sp. SID3343]
MRRLFVAIDPSEAATAELRAAVEPVRADAPEATWSEPRHWHVTLAFLGDVSAAAIPSLADALATVARARPPLRLTLSGVGDFDDRVLWVGVRDEPPVAVESGPLWALAAATRLASGCADARFRAHLTLARGTGMAAVGAGLANFAGTPWIADRLRLVESSAGRGEPARYHDLATWPFGAAPGS